MGSPFAAFRKYQALLLAVFGVLIIVVFTIGDPLSQMAGSGGASQDPVVVTWNGGKLTQSQLYSKRDSRSAVYSFLVRAQSMALQEGGFAEHLPLLRFGIPLPVTPVINEQTLTPLGTVQTILMAQKAEEMGFRVTDSQITSYLSRLVDGKLSFVQLKQIVEGDGPRARNSMRAFYNVLRQEMLAGQLYSQFDRTAIAMPPAEELEYYSRLFRSVQIEGIAIPVEQFLKDVKEPGDSELKAYFEKYKFVSAPVDQIGGVVLDSPDPGFRQPPRVAVEFVQGRADTFVDEVRDQITEAQIEEYYEKNKDLDEFLHKADDLSLPAVDDPDAAVESQDGEETQKESPTDTSDANDNKETKEDANPPDSDGADKKNPDDENTDEPTGDEKKSGDGGDAVGEPKAKTPSAEQDPSSSQESPADGDPAPKADEVEKNSPDGDAADVLRGNALVFTAIQAGDPDAEADSATEAVAPDQASPPPADEQPKQDEAAPTDETKDAATTDETDTEPKSDDTAEPKSDAGAEPKPDAQAANGETAADAAAKAGESQDGSANESGSGDQNQEQPARKKPIYKPLSEVRDYIHRQLAEEKAAELLQKKLDELRANMDSYHKALLYTEEGEQPTQDPPNLKTFAEKNGLEYGKTDLLSTREFTETTEIGKSFRSIQPSRENPSGRIPFVQTAFRMGDFSLFKPHETEDEGGFRFLFWKTAEEEQNVPELTDEIKQKVVRAWKLGSGVDDDSQKARGLVRKRAEELAAQLASGIEVSELATQVDGGETFETESFSWFTPQPRLNQIEGIDAAGPDFMQSVFALEPGGAGVAFNHPRHTAYVFRVISENKSPEVVQQNFLDQMQDRRVQNQIYSAAQLDLEKVARQWFADVEEQLDVQWEKPEIRYAL